MARTGGGRGSGGEGRGGGGLSMQEGCCVVKWGGRKWGGKGEERERERASPCYVSVPQRSAGTRVTPCSWNKPPEHELTFSPTQVGTFSFAFISFFFFFLHFRPVLGAESEKSALLEPFKDAQKTIWDQNGPLIIMIAGAALLDEP